MKELSAQNQISFGQKTQRPSAVKSLVCCTTLNCFHLTKLRQKKTPTLKKQNLCKHFLIIFSCRLIFLLVMAVNVCLWHLKNPELTTSSQVSLSQSNSLDEAISHFSTKALTGCVQALNEFISTHFSFRGTIIFKAFMTWIRGKSRNMASGPEQDSQKAAGWVTFGKSLLFESFSAAYGKDVCQVHKGQTFRERTPSQLALIASQIDSWNWSSLTAPEVGPTGRNWKSFTRAMLEILNDQRASAEYRLEGSASFFILSLQEFACMLGKHFN